MIKEEIGGELLVLVTCEVSLYDEIAFEAETAEL